MTPQKTLAITFGTLYFLAYCSVLYIFLIGIDSWLVYSIVLDYPIYINLFFGNPHTDSIWSNRKSLFPGPRPVSR